MLPVSPAPGGGATVRNVVHTMGRRKGESTAGRATPAQLVDSRVNSGKPGRCSVSILHSGVFDLLATEKGMEGFTIFETPIGACGIAWTEHGIIGVQLPESDVDATRARMARRHPLLSESPPPAYVNQAIDAIRELLRGKRVDLNDVEVHLPAATPFELRVYDAARAIPAGSTKTYGEIAKLIGSPNAAREVGAALGRNPVPIIVPCHRVLAANGKTGGFSAPGGVSTKLRMLAIEGGGGPLFDQF